MREYLAHDLDPRLAQRLAGQSHLPSLRRNDLGSYQPERRSGAGTSMLLSGSSSLAALTSETSVSTASISSSLGVRSLAPRMLVSPVVGDGPLVIPQISHPLQLECPFNFRFCLLTFNNFDDWWEHSLTHFGKPGPPNSSRCCFCDMEFDAATGLECWQKRMEHVELHHQIGARLAHARPDFKMFEYLWNKRLITSAEYKDLKGNGNRNEAARSWHSPPLSPVDDHGRSLPSPSEAVTCTNTNRERGRERQRRPRRP